MQATKLHLLNQSNKIQVHLVIRCLSICKFSFRGSKQQDISTENNEACLYIQQEGQILKDKIGLSIQIEIELHSLKVQSNLSTSTTCLQRPPF